MADSDTRPIDHLIRQRQALEAAVAKDPRYHLEAYLFVWSAFDYTWRRLKAPRQASDQEARARELSGRELLEGICDLAVEQFGYLADLVFARWGITRTDDFGEIVFTLVEVGLLGKSKRDSKEDFRNVFDLRRALRERYRIDTEDAFESDE